MKLYDDLAVWWPLISPPDEYAEEAAYFSSLLAPSTASAEATLLELGSGGGSNAHHMKSRFTTVTLVDLFPPMLDVSRQLNPECDHALGDMRTVRLGRTFDAVFIHDAIDYMTTLHDLRQAIETAFVHCKPGGTTLIVPDAIRETFEPATECGGTDGESRAARYMEWSYDPDPNDNHYITEYVLTLRDGLHVTVEHDQHTLGLFTRDAWMKLFRDVGYDVRTVTDPFGRIVFIGHRT